MQWMRMFSFWQVLESQILKNNLHTPEGIAKLDDFFLIAINLWEQFSEGTPVVAAWTLDPLLCLYDLCTVEHVCRCQQALRVVARFLLRPGSPAVSI